MPTFAGFPKDTTKFLSALKKNNNRDWFNAHKSRYESSIVEPSLQFIEAIKQPLEKISPMFMAVAKKTGGSMMRIYRDTRFAKDKTPYKTNIGIHFRHEFGKTVHAPGFYVHIDPKEVFVGVGIWHPEPKVAKRVRDLIAEQPDRWKKAAHSKAFTNSMHLAGDRLKRPPRGFDPHHPFVDDLMRKDFIAVAELTTKDIHDPAFLTTTCQLFRKAKPLMSFLCEAIEVPF